MLAVVERKRHVNTARAVRSGTLRVQAMVLCVRMSPCMKLVSCVSEFTLGLYRACFVWITILGSGSMDV